MLKLKALDLTWWTQQVRDTRYFNSIQSLAPLQSITQLCLQYHNLKAILLASPSGISVRSLIYPSLFLLILMLSCSPDGSYDGWQYATMISFIRTNHWPRSTIAVGAILGFMYGMCRLGIGMTNFSPDVVLKAHLPSLNSALAPMGCGGLCGHTCSLQGLLSGTCHSCSSFRSILRN